LIVLSTIAGKAFANEALAQSPSRPLARWKRAGENNRRFWLGSGEMKEEHVTSEGVERTYFVYTPTARIQYPAPVVLAFHGGGGTAHSMDKLTGGITKCADDNGFVVVFPEGVSKCWNDGRTVNRKHGLNDVGFISKMCDRLIEDGIADGKRIYATGISNGGFFSQYLALQIPERIAAVASVAATLSDLHEPMMTHKPVAVMYILGVEDPLVPYKGGKIGGWLLRNSRGNAISAGKAVDFWISNNGLSRQNVKETVSDTVPGDGTRVVLREFGQPGERNQLVVYDIEGGGHTWPRGWQYLPPALIGKTSREIDANQVIWAFFKSHEIKPTTAQWQ
jgi:polyhydroxybutyrate depolymerase